MFKEVAKNLFSRTSKRGRLEYFGLTVALSAAVFLLITFGLAVEFMFFSYMFFISAIFALIAYWFVVAQRVRDIGWNVPLVVTTMIIANSLSTYTGLTETGSFVVFGGPLAIVSVAFSILLTVVPGETNRKKKAVLAAA